MSDAELQVRMLRLTEALKRFKQLRHYSKKEFLSDFRNSDATLHNLQNTIGALTDIANYLLKRMGAEIPTTRAMIFERLCDLEFLTKHYVINSLRWFVSEIKSFMSMPL